MFKLKIKYADGSVQVIENVSNFSTIYQGTHLEVIELSGCSRARDAIMKHHIILSEVKSIKVKVQQ